MAIGGDYIPLKLTRKLWLKELEENGDQKFFHEDPETNMSPIEMIFQHRCATAMLILFYEDIERANVLSDVIYELFLYCMGRDFEVLYKNLYGKDYGKDFTSIEKKNLHEVIPRFVGFYKDILGAKDKNGKSLIALFDTPLFTFRIREFYNTNVRLALVMVKIESLEVDYEFFELIFSIHGFLSSSESGEFLQDLLEKWSIFTFETEEEQDIIFKLLPLFRLNLDIINEEDIDPGFLDSILRNPKMSLRILKFLGISLKGRTRIARTLRFHFYKLKERCEQKCEMYYWYDGAVKRLHDFMKQEFDEQRWLEFMQDLRQDQLNDKN